MPETAHAQLADQLAATIHGPYDDHATTATADLAAETIRYLNYATTRGGITRPATITAITADLAAAAYRLPQLLTQLADWLTAETTAGRTADDHHRPAWQLADAARAVLGEAAEHADNLAQALTAAQNLTSTLRIADGTTAPAA